MRKYGVCLFVCLSRSEAGTLFVRGDIFEEVFWVDFGAVFTVFFFEGIAISEGSQTLNFFH